MRLHGKGDKWRTCPLWEPTARIIKQLPESDNGSPAPPKTPVFTARGQPLTRYGIYKIVRRREDLRQAALRALSDPAEREHLHRTRPRIERLLGLIVYRYHARNSRYLGGRKSALQAVWTATLDNLHPIGAALRAQTA